MKQTYYTWSLYAFARQDEAALPAVQRELQQLAGELGVKGLVILAHEGSNAMIAATEETYLERYVERLGELLSIEKWDLKKNESECQPYRKMKVQIRSEIVSSKNHTLDPENDGQGHLTPAEWNEVLQSGDEVAVIDVRNWYETELGMFKGAIDPDTKHFSEFPEYVQNSGIPKDKKVLMYCTGGIRCEKASLEMKSQGYEHVFQLHGGILRYLEQCPEQEFEGECFVFDDRVAVDQKLQPTENFSFCPHCGQPGAEIISCVNCNRSARVCTQCIEKNEEVTCSHNCAHHVQRRKVA